MTDWQLVCLAIMAASLAVMATIQIGLIVIGIKLARQMAATVDEVRREIRPLMEKVNRIADDAQKATSLAVMQVERVDQMLSTTAQRVEETLTLLRDMVGGPLRQGTAAIMAIRAIIAAFKQWQRPARPSREEEDALFVG